MRAEIAFVMRAARGARAPPPHKAGARSAPWSAGRTHASEMRSVFRSVASGLTVLLLTWDYFLRSHFIAFASQSHDLSSDRLPHRAKWVARQPDPEQRSPDQSIAASGRLVGARSATGVDLDGGDTAHASADQFGRAKDSTAASCREATRRCAAECKLRAS